MESPNILQIISDLGRKIEDTMYSLLEQHVHKDFAPIVRYQAQTGGKRIRPAITILFSRALNKANQKAIYGAIGVELIHNYSLIIDDIIDHGDLRRNKETVRAKYSDEMALLASMIYRECIYDCAKLSGMQEQIEEIYSRTIRELVEGERLDIILEVKQDHKYYDQFKTYLNNITEEVYLNMIKRKTAILFSCAAEVGVILGGGSEEQRRSARCFGENAGIAFQIVDDILDLKGEKDHFGKEIGKDIIEGKLTNYPLLLAFQKMGEHDKQRVLEILQQSKPTKEDIKLCLDLVDQFYGFRKAKQRANEYIEIAKTHLDNLFPNNEAIRSLKDSADFIIKRFV